MIRTTWPQTFGTWTTRKPLWPSGYVWEVTSNHIAESPRHFANRTILDGSPKIAGWRAPNLFRAHSIESGSSAVDVWTSSLGRPRNIQAIRAFHGPTMGVFGPLVYKLQKVADNHYRPSISNNIENRAITQALSKASRNQMDIGVALAEAGETLKLLASTAYRVADALHLALTGRFRLLYHRYAAKAYKDPGGIWLEYAFGWKPLIADLQSACDLWNKGLDKRLIVTAKSLVKQDLIDRPPLPTSWYAMVTEFQGFESAFVRLDYQILDQDIQRLKQLGLQNPLAIVWERIPFSFLVDYLLPIGRVLEAAAGSYGLDLLGKSLTRKVEHKGTALITENSAEGVFQYGVRSELRWKTKAVERIVNFGTHPRIYWTNPFSSTGRVANVAALIHSLSRL